MIIRSDRPEGNVHCIIAALGRYRSKLNHKNIQTGRIDKFMEEWMDFDYDHICKKVEELTHGAIKIR
jgi:hypothetical protein